MEIGNRDIWQFGEQYIDADTGDEATTEEIAIFKKQVKQNKEMAAEREYIRQREKEEWCLKYHPLIRKFWEYGDTEQEEEEFQEYVENYDNDDLTYSLATALFDNEDRLEEIKQVFPDHWEKALKWYRDGYHDT